MQFSQFDRFCRALSENKYLLFAFFFLFSSITCPYVGIAHDARLYAFHTLNLDNAGRYSNDLYLKFGSQDRFTVFSYLALPFVKLLGLKPAFFVLYLLGKVLFVSGSLALIRRICSSPFGVILASSAILLNPISYSNLDIFQLNEPFTTPRLFAQALSLWSLNFFMQSRRSASILSATCSCALHVLTTIPALAFLFVKSATKRFGELRGLVLVAILSILMGIVLSSSLIGQRFSALLDPLWYELAFNRAPYLFVQNWNIQDWGRVLLTLGLLFFSGSYLNDAQKRLRFAALLLGFGSLGFAILASFCNSSLLLQLQSFRAFWLVIFFAFVLGSEAASKLMLSSRSTEQVIGFVALSALGTPEPDVSSYFWYRMIFNFFIFSIFSISARGLAPRARNPNWLADSIWISFSSAAIWLWTFLVVLGSSSLASEVHSGEFQALFNRIGFFSALSGGLILPLIGSVTTKYFNPRLNGNSLNIFIILSLAFGVHLLSYSRDSLAPRLSQKARLRDSDLIFISNKVSTLQKKNSAKPLTIYWPLHLEEVWFDLEANNFYSVSQLAGVALNRSLALEGQRRENLVWPFETQAYCSSGANSHFFPWVFSKVDCNSPSATPTKQEIEVLCRKEQIDLLVLESPLPLSQATETNGRIWLLDCAAFS